MAQLLSHSKSLAIEWFYSRLGSKRVMNAQNISRPICTDCRKRVSSWIGISFSLVIFLSSPWSLYAQGPVITKLTSWAKSHGKPPATSEDKTLEQLAANVDWLEHHINQWGSVSSKSPDVWGEARLTQYRRELEEILGPQRNNFNPALISGAQQVSDSAVLAFALALQTQNAGVAAPSISVNSAAVGSIPDSDSPISSVNIQSGLPVASNAAFGASTTTFLGGTLGLEQTQMIDQLNRYVQHVNQHRRINEGDDTSDAPGYALNLVRIPVSILPGNLTKRGYGAEITFTAKSYLGPDLLPMTFRDMVLNDLTDQLSIPLVKFVNSDPNGADLLLSSAKYHKPSQTGDARFSDMENSLMAKPFGSVPRLPAELDGGNSAENNSSLDLTRELLTSVCAISFSGNQSRRGSQPFPPTQIIDVYGLDEMKVLAIAAMKGLREDVPNRRVAHVTDVKAFLREEISAAIELMYSGSMQMFWDRESTGERYLYQIIRNRNTYEIDQYRNEFLASIPRSGRSDLCQALAWCVFVDSILLNERLNDDMRETAGTRPSAFAAPCWTAFFGPDPSVEARETFAQYVQIRWPVRVFALDPQVDQQSVADVSSVVRQMQLAVVLGFSSGDIGLSTALDTIRKLQRDRATIDLNRTAIAFGQGEDTFGWRFQPRFQTPPVEGNAKVFFRDLVSGGPTDKQLERGYEIEPGMRECTAIILMPSFVPYVTFETHGHWFKLVHPGHTGTSIQDEVKLSRAIKQMQDCAEASVRCAHLYRDGEVDRVMARVQQLERRLPLQTIACQVPIENTHGGFELFCNGTRQLAPEVSGSYGSPGYDVERGASLFIAGDNFSMKQTHVICGNHYLPTESVKLISRQILQVDLPTNLPILRDSRLIEHENSRLPFDQRYSGYVDLQVATPYGVSSHLLIPVVANGGFENNPMANNAGEIATFQIDGEGAGIEAGLEINRTGTITKLLVRRAMLPEVRVPNGFRTTTVNRNVRLYLSHGADKIAPVLFKDVSQSGPKNSYQIGADTFLESADTKGNLLEAVKHYIEFLESNNLVPNDSKIVFNAQYTLEIDKVEIPVVGTFPFVITLPPPK